MIEIRRVADDDRVRVAAGGPIGCREIQTSKVVAAIRRKSERKNGAVSGQAEEYHQRR